MNPTLTALKTSKPCAHPKSQCCDDDGCGPGLRNNYYLGKRLTPDSFRVEQNYLIERRRLLNRALYGWGVVYGYAVTAADPASGGETPSGRLAIGPGLALDECGRELVHPCVTMLGYPDVIVLDETSARMRPRSRRDGRDDRDDEDCEKQFWLLSVHYAEQSRGQVTVPDPCCCTRNEWDYACETVRYTLRRVDRDECCAPQDCELRCECGKGMCCDEERLPDTDDKHREDKWGRQEEHESHADARKDDATSTRSPVKRGAGCLCHHLATLDPGCDCEALCEIDDPCGDRHVRIDYCNGVPLACVRLCRNECGHLVFDEWIEACGPRRLVKRNDLLFDLIRGCDLTRISWISWGHWHRRDVNFDDFAKFFDAEGEPEGTTRFKVRFSRPVRVATMTEDCFAMWIIFLERRGDYRQMIRVPIDHVRTNGDEDGLATEATLVARPQWAQTTLLGDSGFDSAFGAHVEIEIRGDYILDCNGQAVDANAIGRDAYPSGKGYPGGIHLTSFRVRRR